MAVKIVDQPTNLTYENAIGSPTLYRGIKLLCNKNCKLVQARKTSLCTADTCYLLADDATTVLDSAPFNGIVASLNLYNLQKGSSYYVVVKNDDDSAYAGRADSTSTNLPVPREFVTYTAGLEGVDQPYGLNILAVAVRYVTLSGSALGPSAQQEKRQEEKALRVARTRLQEAL